MKIIPLILCSLLFAGWRPAALAAEGAHASVRALLVLASNQRGASDARLADYEPTLRRILRFESYKLAGEGSAALAAGTKSTVRLARGHALELEMDKSDGRSVRVKVAWTDGRRPLMNTGLVLRPGVPAVLGGPANGKDGDVWAVILVAD